MNSYMLVQEGEVCGVSWAINWRLSFTVQFMLGAGSRTYVASNALEYRSWIPGEYSLRIF